MKLKDRYSGFKPQDKITGASSSPTPHIESRSTGTSAASIPAKRKTEEDLTPSAHPNPHLPNYSNGEKYSHSKKTKNSHDLQPLNRYGKSQRSQVKGGSESEPEDIEMGNGHSTDQPSVGGANRAAEGRNGLSKAGSVGHSAGADPQEADTRRRRPKHSNSTSDRHSEGGSRRSSQSAERAPQTVRLQDYDKEFLYPNKQPDHDLRDDRETSEELPAPSLGQTPKSDDGLDSELGIKTKRRKDHKKMSLSHLTKLEDENHNKSVSKMEQRSTELSVQHPKELRLKDVFIRDNGKDSADELTKSSPAGGLKDRLNMPPPQSKSSLKMAHTARKVTPSQTSEDEVSEGDSRRVNRLLNRSTPRGTSRSRKADGRVLSSYVHNTKHEGPFNIRLERKPPSLRIVAENDVREVEILANDIKKAFVSEDGLHARFTVPRSEKYLDTVYHFVFATHNDLVGFQNDLATLSIKADHEAEETLKKKFDQRSKESSKPAMASPREEGGVEEEALVQKRFQNGRQNGIDIPASYGKMTKSGPKLIEKLGHIMLQPKQSQTSGVAPRNSRAGKDDIFYELASDLRPSRPKRRSAASDLLPEQRSSLADKDFSPLRMSTRSSQGTNDHGKARKIEPDEQKVNLGPPWEKPLAYPPTGRSRVVVEFEDLSRLQEDEFLNDNLIQFGVRFAQEQQKDRADDIYVFNTYFYESLTKGCKGKTNINYEAVKRWTAKVDLFSFNYVVVPINENLHWYVAIICNLRNIQKSCHQDDSDIELAGQKASISRDAAQTPKFADLPRSNSDDLLEEKTSRLTIRRNDDSVPRSSSVASRAGSVNAEIVDDLESEGSLDQDKKVRQVVIQEMVELRSAHSKKRFHRKSSGQPFKEDECAIITLDSLGHARGAAIRNIKDYLVEEARTKRGMDIVEPRGLTAKGIPLQKNYSDCGLYLVNYVHRLFENPESLIGKILGRTLEPMGDDWPTMDPSKMRSRMQRHIKNEWAKQNYGEIIPDTPELPARPVFQNGASASKPQLPERPKAVDEKRSASVEKLDALPPCARQMELRDIPTTKLLSSVPEDDRKSSHVAEESQHPWTKPDVQTERDASAGIGNSHHDHDMLDEGRSHANTRGTPNSVDDDRQDSPMLEDEQSAPGKPMYQQLQEVAALSENPESATSKWRHLLKQAHDGLIDLGDIQRIQQSAAPGFAKHGRPPRSATPQRPPTRGKSAG